MKFLAWLKELSTISPLPAWALTFTVCGIWIAAGLGFAPAAEFWEKNAPTIASTLQWCLGIWLGAKTASRISDAVTTKGESVEIPPAVAP